MSTANPHSRYNRDEKPEYTGSRYYVSYNGPLVSENSRRKMIDEIVNENTWRRVTRKIY